MSATDLYRSYVRDHKSTEVAAAPERFPTSKRLNEAKIEHKVEVFGHSASVGLSVHAHDQHHEQQQPRKEPLSRGQSWATAPSMAAQSVTPAATPRENSADAQRAPRSVDKWISAGKGPSSGEKKGQSRMDSASRSPTHNIGSWGGDYSSEVKGSPTGELGANWMVDSAPIRAMILKMEQQEATIAELREVCGNAPMYKAEAGKVGPLRGQVKALQSKLHKYEAGEHPLTSGVASAAASAQQPLINKIGELSRKLYETEKQVHELRTKVDEQDAQILSMQDSAAEADHLLNLDGASDGIDIHLDEQELQIAIDVQQRAHAAVMSLPNLPESSLWLTDRARAIEETAEQAWDRSREAELMNGWESIQAPQGLHQGTVDMLERGKLVIVRVQSVIPTAASTVIELLSEAQGGPKDATVHMLEHLSATSCLLHIQVKVPVVQDREFVCCQWITEEEGSTVVVRASLPAEAAAEAVAPTSRFTRGRIVLQSTTVTPINDNQCSIKWISCVDPAGKIPTQKTITAKEGGKTIIALQNASIMRYE